MRKRLVAVAAAAALLACGVAAQPREYRELELGDGATLHCAVGLPEGYDAARAYPLVLALAAGAPARDAVESAFSECLAGDAGAGWIAVMPVGPAAEDGTGAAAWMAPLLQRLRETFRIAGGRIYLADADAGGRGARLAAAHAYHFHAPVRLAADTMQQLAELQRAAAPAGPTAAVEAALDDFHDAAAKGDEERYFGRFAPEGVFLGTDATERWTLAEFRAFALPYFERPSAWVYVPQSRHVELSPSGDVAWFDEVLGHDRFGECRGTGVLRSIGGSWRLARYNLTVPIPNDLLESVAQRIRALARGEPAAVTTVVLVRHAEKEPGAGDDPPLTAAGRARAASLAGALRSAGVGAVYVSEYRRTAETAAPLCEQLGLSPRVVSARDVGELARRLRDGHAGETVLVVGHSNTIPALARRLGAPGDIVIGDGDHDDLLVVALEPEGARVLRLRYGVSWAR